MTIQLPELPYPKNALEPHISEETLEYHYSKHHQTYVNNLNKLIADTQYRDLELEEIIKSSEGGIFNNAAQIWNHTFYWSSLSPSGGGKPTGKALDLIMRDFESFENFKELFSIAAITNFGSGWTWLVLNIDGKLEIKSTSNAQTPLTSGETPLLTIDVWEHAYYIDYRNARPRYVESFWNLVNWEFVNENLK